MGIIAVIALLASFAFGIVYLKKASNYTKEQWYNNLSTSNKRNVVGYIKSFWKVGFVDLALVICCALILLSVTINKENTRDLEVSIMTIIYSLISTIIIYSSKKKCDKKISEINRNFNTDK